MDLQQPFRPPDAIGFNKFLENPDLINDIAATLADPDTVVELNRVILANLFPSLSVCPGSILLINYTQNILRGLANLHPYLQPLVESISDSEFRFRFSVEIDPSDPTYNYNQIKADKMKEQIKICAESGKRFIFLTVVMYITRNPETDRILMKHNLPEQKFSLHGHSLVLDLETNEAYFLNTYRSPYDYIILESLTVYLNHILGREIGLNRVFVGDRYRRYNLQAPFPLCGAWSIYLMLLYILNTDKKLKDIYLNIIKLPDLVRQSLIFRFMYDLYARGIFNIFPLKKSTKEYVSARVLPNFQL